MHGGGELGNWQIFDLSAPQHNSPENGTSDDETPKRIGARLETKRAIGTMNE